MPEEGEKVERSVEELEAENAQLRERLEGIEEGRARPA